MTKQVMWTDEAIKKGFERFFAEHERYPTTPEIDSSHYLPSSRQLQRRFGGVPVIRERLGLPISDFTKGSARSEMAINIGERGRKEEQIIYKILTDYFGEVFIHGQKPFNNYSCRRILRI